MAQQSEGDASPPIQLHCASALETSFVPAEQMERAKIVMQSAPRMPAVGFFGARYGEKWYVDMVALTHNAVRRQLYDAFTIANALGKLTLDVAEADLARVYAWMGTLDRFVNAVFKAEDRFLYPVIDTNIRKAKTADGSPVYLPELLSVRGRQKAKLHILELLSSARKTRDVATGETTAKINALRYALDQFGAKILDYFVSMEKFVPKMLKKGLKNGVKEKEKMEKKMFEFFLGEGHGAMLAALLMQCIESRSRRSEFLGRSMKRVKDRESFKLHVKKVEATHMQVAPVFDDVAQQYERRFNVNMFLEQYEADRDGQATLQMLGDIDINDDGVRTVEVDEVDEVDDEEDDQFVDVAVPVALPEPDVTDVTEVEDGVGMDDDVLEVYTVG